MTAVVTNNSNALNRLRVPGVLLAGLLLGSCNKEGATVEVNGPRIFRSQPFPNTGAVISGELRKHSTQVQSISLTAGSDGGTYSVWVFLADRARQKFTLVKNAEFELAAGQTSESLTIEAPVESVNLAINVVLDPGSEREKKRDFQVIGAPTDKR